MKIKKCIAILFIFFVVIALSPNQTFAKKGGSGKSDSREIVGSSVQTNPVPTIPSSSDTVSAPGLNEITSGMSGVGNATTGGKISNILNAVIKLIQVAGSGVAVIVVTMLRHKIHACKFVRKSRY